MEVIAAFRLLAAAVWDTVSLAGVYKAVFPVLLFPRSLQTTPDSSVTVSLHLCTSWESQLAAAAGIPIHGLKLNV